MFTTKHLFLLGILSTTIHASMESTITQGSNGERIINIVISDNDGSLLSQNGLALVAQGIAPKKTTENDEKKPRLKNLSKRKNSLAIITDVLYPTDNQAIITILKQNPSIVSIALYAQEYTRDVPETFIETITRNTHVRNIKVARYLSPVPIQKIEDIKFFKWERTYPYLAKTS